MVLLIVLLALLRALCGKLHPLGNSSFTGSVYYDGDSIDSKKFLVRKVADYIEQGDTHEATLTVKETLMFSWMCSTGDHKSYGFAKDEQTADLLDENRDHTIITNCLLALGLDGCKGTFIGGPRIRGVSGGQKRRTTIGEMIVCPRPVKMMDCITSGLDSATAYDIMKAIKLANEMLGLTNVTSLLQPPPDVYALFDEIILLHEGHIIYQGSREQVRSYFEGLGYFCPGNMDEADFLQELPTPEGRRFIKTPNAPHRAEDLAKAWKSSELFQQLLAEMRYPSAEDARVLSGANEKLWHLDFTEKYPASFWFYFKLCFIRQFKVVFRDSVYLKARIGQNLIMGAITGSLFNNISKNDVNTMNGFLFNTILFNAMGGFDILPIIFDQKAVYYKHRDALFFPSVAFTFAQTITMLPVQIVENIVYVTIIYWSAGLSADYNGSRFLTYIVISLALAMPKSVISNGWIWFYWINPIAWALKAVTLNEFASPKYDYDTCLNTACTEKERTGDFVLKQYGNPTDEKYIWYSFAVLIGHFLLFFSLTALAYEYVRIESIPPPPIRQVDTDDNAEDNNNDGNNDGNNKAPSKEDYLPFDPISFAFDNIWYSVTLPNGEVVDLLKGVNGYFEPGSITALMGSTGAGKTTLLDVLSGRKNTGVVKGDMYHNGIKKNDHYFRRIMAYVEQFDSLPSRCTPKEIIEFNACLRLVSSVSTEQRILWVASISKMMDLGGFENSMIGDVNTGGLSFEQRKRVSIGTELAANPSILFLDEPTTGLDSFAAQALVRNIRTVAETGRTVVCTIHQPSSAIFHAFDNLLLLKRGGQVVYFGPIGEQGRDLIGYFESAPNVTPIPSQVNPATWMLEVIGAGTSGQSATEVDFAAFYTSSTLCATNAVHLSSLIQPNSGSQAPREDLLIEDKGYSTSYWTQFYLVLKRYAVTYWRTPSYLLVRVAMNLLIALIFSSAYPNQKYSDAVETTSRATMLALYSIMNNNLVPVFLLTTLFFTVPFFYIVGFDSPGNEAQKFMWYWFFSIIMQATVLYMGNMFVALAPDESTIHILGGVASMIMAMFCGFLITQDSFPTFWLFVYWLNPFHYALEGLIMTQFHKDDTIITAMDGSKMTAEHFMTEELFKNWSYDQVGYDVLALGLQAFAFLVATYVCLLYLRHDKR
eukprot:scaffold5237_cov170-Ochromonas_danica.AAC.17